METAQQSDQQQGASGRGVACGLFSCLKVRRPRSSSSATASPSTTSTAKRTKASMESDAAKTSAEAQQKTAATGEEVKTEKVAGEAAAAAPAAGGEKEVKAEQEGEKVPEKTVAFQGVGGPEQDVEEAAEVMKGEIEMEEKKEMEELIEKKKNREKEPVMMMAAGPVEKSMDSKHVSVGTDSRKRDEEELIPMAVMGEEDTEKRQHHGVGVAGVAAPSGAMWSEIREIPVGGEHAEHKEGSGVQDMETSPGLEGAFVPSGDAQMAAEKEMMEKEEEFEDELRRGVVFEEMKAMDAEIQRDAGMIREEEEQFEDEEGEGEEEVILYEVKEDEGEDEMIQRSVMERAAIIEKRIYTEQESAGPIPLPSALMDDIKEEQVSPSTPSVTPVPLPASPPSGELVSTPTAESVPKHMEFTPVTPAEEVPVKNESMEKPETVEFVPVASPVKPIEPVEIAVKDASIEKQEPMQEERQAADTLDGMKGEKMHEAVIEGVSMEREGREESIPAVMMEEEQGEIDETGKHVTPSARRALFTEFEDVSGEQKIEEEQGGEEGSSEEELDLDVTAAAAPVEQDGQGKDALPEIDFGSLKSFWETKKRLPEAASFLF